MENIYTVPNQDYELFQIISVLWFFFPSHVSFRGIEV